MPHFLLNRTIPFVMLVVDADASYVLKLVLMQVSHFILSRSLWCRRSQWPRGVRRRSAAARQLKSWVRIPPGSWMSVCCECCVLSGRGLCVGLIARSKESYRLWCVIVCGLETSWTRRPWPTGRLSRQKQTTHGGVNYKLESWTCDDVVNVSCLWGRINWRHLLWCPNNHL